jgi:methylmalonyl-CoA mutase N-terminal domain/subunit
LRFHAQTSGATLTAQQPLNNVVRVTWQALAAVLGGTQSLHTNSYDEALALPSQPAAELALRTQQLIAHESGAAAVVDPLGGSYLIEDLTSRVAEAARKLIDEIDDLGGAVTAIESGFYQQQIHESAFRRQQAVESGEAVVVGVNQFTETSAQPVEIHQTDAALEADQIRRLERVRSRRDAGAVKTALENVKTAASGTENLLPPMRTALAANATVGEICDTLREVFGTYHANEGF